MFSFVSVFHRILDFKTGLDFYPGPFFILPPSGSSPGLSQILKIAAVFKKFPFPVMSVFQHFMIIDQVQQNSLEAIKD